MNYRPLGMRVLVETEKMGSKTKSGIIVSTQSRTDKVRGIVKAIGTTVKSTEVAVGDKVFFDKMSAVYIPQEDVTSEDFMGSELVLIHKDDLLAVIES